ncbi:uncharacterized protein LOC143470009 [Clavelina lepadiformis]|uniref:uncharacterized protein LOC143470009 n=1 Tax=Clavelina lepadiformis TaxID=159417 RepID=UPI004041D886
MFKALQISSIVASVLAFVLVLVSLTTIDWIKFCVNVGQHQQSSSGLAGFSFANFNYDTCYHIGLFQVSISGSVIPIATQPNSDSISNATAAFLIIGLAILIPSVWCSVQSGFLKTANNNKMVLWQKLALSLQGATGISLLIAALIYSIGHKKILEDQNKLINGIQNYSLPSIQCKDEECRKNFINSLDIGGGSIPTPALPSCDPTDTSCLPVLPNLQNYFNSLDIDSSSSTTPPHNCATNDVSCQNNFVNSLDIGSSSNTPSIPNCNPTDINCLSNSISSINLGSPSSQNPSFGFGPSENRRKRDTTPLNQASLDAAEKLFGQMGLGAPNTHGFSDASSYPEVAKKIAQKLLTPDKSGDLHFDTTNSAKSNPFTGFDSVPKGFDDLLDGLGQNNLNFDTNKLRKKRSVLPKTPKISVEKPTLFYSFYLSWVAFVVVLVVLATSFAGLRALENDLLKPPNAIPI